MIPAIAFLGVFFWIVLSAVKYWYYSRVNYNYSYKLDEKTLEEIRRPPEHVLEKMKNKQRAREEKMFADKPEGNFLFKDNENRNSSYNFSDTGNDSNKPSSANEDAKCKGGRPRPPTLFEEMDLLKEKQKDPTKNSSKYDRSVFDDPLTKLYREIKELKQQQATLQPKNNTQE